MTEYWKSQARKYCEFCKCWFADNKVSISFHENGKRHKENVQKHISTLSKKSAKEFKQKEKIDDTMKKMEAAAMAAYLKDVQNNADITSQSINELAGTASDSNTTIVVGDSHKAKSAPLWHEIKGEDGNCYYWNTTTNETSWDAPDEYLSLGDQETKALKQTEAEKKKEKQQEKINKKRQDEAVEELKAHLAREKMRELAVKEPVKARTPVDYGPAPAARPYGSWKPVVHESTESIDLQLPKVVEPPPPPVIMLPETIQFKEKKVESLGEGPVEFKKRKLNNNKRNMRQKVDEE